MQKGGITYIINHNFARIRIDSYNYLPIEKILTFHNIIILISLVVNENKNYYCYNVCYRCDDLLMMSINLSDVAILNIKVLIIAALLVELVKVILI